MNKLQASLYSRLIKPVEEHLPQSTDNNLIIIPHDILFHLPFLCLTDTSNMLLIQKHTVAFSFSLSILVAKEGIAKLPMQNRHFVAIDKFNSEWMIDTEEEILVFFYFTPELMMSVCWRRRKSVKDS
ncbi:MAG: CHAT domain-containing protein [Candidatus Bathyarchaeia archaeon]